MASRNRRRLSAPARRSKALLLTGPLAIAGVIAGAWGGSVLASHRTAEGADSGLVAGRLSGGGVTIGVRPSTALQAQLGQKSIDVSLPAGADVGALLNRLSTDYPVLAAMGPSIMVAVSGSMAAPDTALVDAETVDLMSPLAGG